MCESDVSLGPINPMLPSSHFDNLHFLNQYYDTMKGRVVTYFLLQHINDIAAHFQILFGCGV